MKKLLLLITTITLCSMQANEDMPETINVTVGETMTVALPIQAGTGYTWQLEPSTVTLLDKPEIARQPMPRPGLVGGPAQMTFKLQAPSEAGCYSVTFRKIAPGGKPVNESKQLIVSVKEREPNGSLCSE